MSNIIRDQIINEWSSQTTQELYVKKAEEGLWGSEEILIKKYFEPKSTILDIGCGTGRTTIHLSKLEYKVTGLDFTPAMIKNAMEIAKSKKIKINYEVGDATDLKFKESSFDNVLFSFNGWAQIPGENNRIKALTEIFRVLKPDGHFIFTSLIRKIQGYGIFWIKQWIKEYILKPLGFNIKEVDFGDVLFYRKGNSSRSNQKQYMHYPSIKEVKGQIAKAGFNLVFIERSDAISSKKTGEAPPMFYVCKKIK